MPSPTEIGGNPPIKPEALPKPGEGSKGRGKIVVALQSARFGPGTGPRLRPITLLPRADTTAYIRGEFIMPREASGDGKIHVVYLLGWTDLPSARLTVDAKNILDYVSEREYEQWNFERSEERDELERRLEEEENVKAVEQAILAEQQEGIMLRNGTLRLTGSESGASREATPSKPALKRKPGRPLKAAAVKTSSLLHPGPPALDLGATESESTSNDEEAILRQLESEERSVKAESRDVSANLQPPAAKKRRTASPKPPPSTAVAQPGPRRETAVPIPIIPPRRPQLLATKTPTVAGPSNYRGSASEVSAARSSWSTSFTTPLSKAAKAKPATLKTGFTPLASGFGKAASTLTPERPRKSVSPGPSTATQSKKAPATTPKARVPPPPKKSAKKPKTPKSDPTEIVRFEANQSWEVKRLLETRLFDVAGKTIRQFLVLWKGDWPPDQNPTWEPQDNIPKAMARKFLLTHAANIGMDGAGDTPPRWRPERTFSSVSEAFAGDSEEQSTDSRGGFHDGRSWDDDEDDIMKVDEELLVTDDPTPRRASFAPSTLDWEMAMGRRFGEGMTGRAVGRADS